MTFDMTTPQDPQPGWSVSPRLAIAVLLLLSTAALAARVMPIWSQIFPAPGHVRLLGVDPYYHLRHARFVADNIPHLQRWDVGTHYPDGQWSDAAGLFDLAMGSAAWLIGLGDPTNDLVDRVVAWTPPLLAALSIWLLYLLARTMLDRRTALLAAAIFLIYPGSSLHRSLLGFADHHVAEIVLALLTAWGLMRCLQTGESSKPVPPWWRPACEYAWPLAIFLFTWVGAPIYVLLVFVVLLIVATVEIAHGGDSNAAAHGGLRYGSALLLMVGVSSVLWPDLVMSPKRFSPALLGCAAVALVPAAYVFAARRLLRRLNRPRLIAFFAAAVVVVLAALFMAHADQARHLAALLLTPKRSALTEHLVIDWRLYGKLLGAPGLLALAALPLGLWRAVRRPGDRFCLVPLLFGVLLIGLWLRTHDYDYAPPVFVALMAAFVTAEVAGRIPARHVAWMRWVGSTTLAALLLCPIWPLRLVAMPMATARMATNHSMTTQAWEQAMTWMRQNTPKPSLPVDTRVEPFGAGFDYPPGTYGVFTAWDFGNIVNTLGERVPVWSRWPSARTAMWIVSEDEEESLGLLCPGCEEGEEVRYVVLEARTIAQHFLGKVLAAGRQLRDYDTGRENWQSLEEDEKILNRTYGHKYERSMAVRLFRDDARHLGHYRLVYESPRESYITYQLKLGTNTLRRLAYDIKSDRQREVVTGRARTGQVTRFGNHYQYDGIVTPSVKIFEVVQGARLTGEARAGTAVEARLELRCGSGGRRVDYVRSVVAGSDGHFDLVVAHSSEPVTDNATCEAIGPYSLFVRNTLESEMVPAGTVAISVRQVRDGAHVDLGRFLEEWKRPPK